MTLQKKLSFGLVAALSLFVFACGDSSSDKKTASTTEKAVSTVENGVFANKMTVGVKGFSCADEKGASIQLAGETAPGASVDFPITALADKETCARLYVTMDNGAAWQFYPHESEEPIKGFILEMDGPHSMEGVPPEDDKKHPSLRVEWEKDAMGTPAGLPVKELASWIQFGLQESQWKELLVPGSAALTNPNAFIVSFADLSWSLVGDGLSHAQATPTMTVISGVTVGAPIADTTLFSIFASLQEMGAAPWTLESGGTTEAFTEEGKILNAAATLKTGVTPDIAWQYIEAVLRNAAPDSEPIQIVFGSEDIIYTLQLNLDISQAFLTVERRPGAAFG